MEEHHKQRFSMLTHIEKARKNLSLDSEAHMIIDVFWNGIDYERELRIEEFEGWIEDETNQLKTLIEDTLQKLLEQHEISKDQITAVELLGECTRTPIFITAIKKGFN